MYPIPPEERYIFVIDTESYAGNFERDMCAFCTGETGECGVGQEQAEVFRKEMKYEDEGPFADIIESRPDDRGCCRPTSMWPTPGWWCPGMGAGYYRDGQEEEAQKEYQEKCKEEAERVGERDKERFLSMQNEPLRKLMAYFSVAIFFHKPPEDAHIDCMMSRAHTYAKKESLTITGFRLLKETTTTVTVTEWHA